MFAFHSNTRNYIKRRDAPAAAPANSSPINFSTEWKCEQGVIWPKIVNYAVQCCKGHNLSCYQPPPSSTTPVPPKLCRLCSAELLLHPPPDAPHTTSHCLYCDYMTCRACVDAVAPHSQQPPPPPPPSLLHRGVHLNVLRQFKKNWACTYSRWTTEQVRRVLSRAFRSYVHRRHVAGLPAAHQATRSALTLQLLLRVANNLPSHAGRRHVVRQSHLELRLCRRHRRSLSLF